MATNFEDVVVMLDPDATQQALKMKKRYSFLFRNFSVVVLSNDPKGTDFTELEEKLIGAENTYSSSPIQGSI